MDTFVIDDDPSRQPLKEIDMDNTQRTTFPYKKDDNKKNGIKQFSFLHVNVAILQNHEYATDKIHKALQEIRHMSSRQENNFVIEQILNSGVLSCLVRLLNQDVAKIQFEAAWTLTNIATTEHARRIVEEGAIPSLIRLLSSPAPNVCEQSAWCLGNIAGDASDLRDIVLREGALDPMLNLISNPTSNSLLCNSIWAVCNLCRGKPQPQLDCIGKAIPILSNILLVENCSTAIMETCWALAYLTDGGDENRIQAVMNRLGLTQKIVSLLCHECSSIVTPAVHLVGNFVSGSNEQTQAVLDAGVLNYIGCLLKYPKDSVRKETCWLISNIAAGTQHQIDQLMCYSREMLLIVDTVRVSAWDVRKEATWVLCNVATGGTGEHVHNLVTLGGIDALCAVLENVDLRMTEVVLDAISNILRVGKDTGRDYIHFIHDCGGFDKIEALQDHHIDSIYQKVIELIEMYLVVDEDEDEQYEDFDENLQYISDVLPNLHLNKSVWGIPQ